MLLRLLCETNTLYIVRNLLSSGGLTLFVMFFGQLSMSESVAGIAAATRNVTIFTKLPELSICR